MLIAEALAERADVQTRLAELTRRAEQVARVQEGDRPDEDPQALLAEADRLLDRLEELVAAINRTNSATAFDETRTVSDALTARDVAQRRRTLYAGVADAAAQRQDRYSRSEVKFVATVDVAALRRRADLAAKEFRELDTRLQRLNWTTELR